MIWARSKRRARCQKNFTSLKSLTLNLMIKLHLVPSSPPASSPLPDIPPPLTGRTNPKRIGAWNFASMSRTPFPKCAL